LTAGAADGSDMTGTGDAPPLDGAVELRLPADTRLVRVARLVASGVGTTIGFDVEEIEDLRVAVDEGCSALIEGGDRGPLMLKFEFDDRAVVVRGNTTAAAPPSGVDTHRLHLSEQILALVVDDHELVTDGNRVSFRLRKQRAFGPDGWESSGDDV
jgi:serine/threonine-protein kinase RsbW